MASSRRACTRFLAAFSYPSSVRPPRQRPARQQFFASAVHDPLLLRTTSVVARTWQQPAAVMPSLGNSNPSSGGSSVALYSTMIGNDINLAKSALKQADCVCFDVDSTVITEEGIDVLAESLGEGPAVADLTKQAMEGGMKFQDALQARLELLQPSRQSIEQCLKDNPLELSPGVAEFIQALHQRGTHVYLVSGGFRIMIEPVAELLNIPKERIVANTILFHDDDGSYQSFDGTEPTSQDMGKPRALSQIQGAGGYQTMIMIGDGATDAQAKPPAKAFIGFGGVAVRAAVQDKADWFVTDFASLTAVLKE